MSVIKVLDNESAVKIAAGEVVENAASVIKELIENSVDAGAKHITVEIRNGGKSFIRVTDDGCGMAFDDAKNAFLRHATSKIRSIDDLSTLSTMGFRGEALAALAAVSRVTLYTKRAEDELGAEVEIEGGRVLKHEESGLKDGTTIIVKDLFYNTPARLKFLKRDATEASYVAQITEREALARPDISFTFIKDGAESFFTDGSGRLLSAISSIYGNMLSSSLLPLKADIGGVSVSGYICKSSAAKATRDMQIFYVNGRYVKNKTFTAALESGYANELMVKRFPVCFLNLKISPSEIDINVSPSKTEIKFSQSVSVFDAIYFAVKEALSKDSGREEIEFPKEKEKKSEFESLISSVSSFVDEKPKAVNGWVIEKKETEKRADLEIKKPTASKASPTVLRESLFPVISAAIEKEKEIKEPEAEKEPFSAFDIASSIDVTVSEEIGAPESDYVIKGEIFKSYILVEKDDELIIIDKHAAHERILFERLKKEQEKLSAQYLLAPEKILLSPARAGYLSDCSLQLERFGFDCSLKDGQAEVLAIPSLISEKDTEAMLCEVLDLLGNETGSDLSVTDKIYHSIACRAAVKAGKSASAEDMKSLVKAVIDLPDIKHCPHGRPVAVFIKKSYIDGRFGR
ncbi:MAG: DNA mismatch repair endonuclease MutL [Clostridia bacterium]|nr:DNA mismatch repair endonuclease MutL [Clostridia bacterium]